MCSPRFQPDARHCLLGQVTEVCWRRGRRHLERQPRHLVGDSSSDGQPIERPEERTGICSISTLTGDSGQVVLRSLQYVEELKVAAGAPIKMPGLAGGSRKKRSNDL